MVEENGKTYVVRTKTVKRTGLKTYKDGILL